MSKISSVTGEQSDSWKPNEDLINLTWENLNVNVIPPNENIFTKVFKKKKLEQRYHIVQDVSGIAKPGQILAIMGASGAGKTTLLNVLTFRSNRNLNITGSVKVNGRRITDSSELSSISAYVEQDDIFIGTLKVKEHLKFQAMLRMGKNATSEEKNARVEEVLNELNLKKCEDTLIGVAQLGIKGISGGERRRLAFASEIITNPGLLFCDEPTSGLDSFMAMSIVDSMKELASRGKTIICTIHQPSSEIFERFDRLFLMAEGRLAYTGDLLSAHQFFSSNGFNCPVNYNPADFFINTLAISPIERDKCQKRVKAICDNFESSSINEELRKQIDPNELTNRSVIIQSEKKFKHLLKIFSVFILNSFIKNLSYKSNTFTQLKWLIWRTALGTARNPMETKISFLNTIFIAVLFGLIYFKLKINQKGVQDINGVLFLLITNVSFSNMFPVINSFPPELPIFFREHKNKMYRVANYLLARFLVELPRFILFPFLFCTIIYFMVDLNNDVEKYFICCGTIILCSFAAVSLGSFISAASPSLNVAIAIAAPILVPLMIFSGYFLNNKSIPAYFIWLKYLSWLGYGNEVLVINQWDNIRNITCDPGQPRCFQNGEQVISYFKMNENNFNLDFVYILCLIIGWRLLTYVALKLKVKFN